MLLALHLAAWFGLFALATPSPTTTASPTSPPTSSPTVPPTCIADLKDTSKSPFLLQASGVALNDWGNYELCTEGPHLAG